jgi:ribose transport system ATP-binding protein
MTNAEHNGLVVRGVSKRFGATQALDHIDLDVRPGEVVALLGENGAGKSTLSNIVAGTFAPDTGSMTWRGQPYAPAAPGDAIAAGIGMIHQELRLLPDLSVAENVFVGRWPMNGGKVDYAQMNRRAAEQLHRLGLDIAATRPVRTLRVAAQQQVEIAKALTLEAKLLLLDEPTAALGAEETDHLFERIDQLRAEGVSFIYVSHRLEEIARIADRVVVLRDGQWVASHDTAQVPVSRLIQDMVGRSLEQIFPDTGEPRHDEVLRVSGLSSAEGAFQDVSFEVHEGEVLGIAGIVGAGRTELVRAIAGADVPAAGEVTVDGRPLRLGDPRSAIRAGVVLVPEDRKGQGVVLDLPIADNIAVSNLDRLAESGWIKPARVREVARHAIERLQVKGAPEQPVRALSGGNQQKVVIAKSLVQEPDLIIFDEPTRGVDVGAIVEIHELINQLADEGKAVVVISSYLPEIMALSDRILVSRQGKVVEEFSALEATEERIMYAAIH